MIKIMAEDAITTVFVRSTITLTGASSSVSLVVIEDSLPIQVGAVEAHRFGPLILRFRSSINDER